MPRVPLASEQVSPQGCSINKPRINQVILQQMERLPRKPQEFQPHPVIFGGSSGQRVSRLPGCLSCKSHAQVLWWDLMQIAVHHPKTVTSVQRARLQNLGSI